MIVRVSLAALLIVGWTPVGAQICLGHAPFSAGPVRIAGTFTRPEGGTTYAGEIGLGRPLGPFGSVGVSRAVADQTDATTTSVDAHVGYQARTTSAQPVEYCVLGGVGYVSIDADLGTTRNTASGIEYDIGAGGGKRIPMGDVFDVIPSVLVQFLGSRVSGSTGTDAARFSLPTKTNSYGLMTLGVGVLLEQRLTVKPFVGLPFSENGGKHYFGVTVAVSVGRPSRRT